MTDRPIIFSAGMVHALLSGRKTQHRVPLKPQPGVVPFNGGVAVLCCEDGYAVAGQTKPQPMPYAVGDRLWVKEQCATWEGNSTDATYRATMGDDNWADMLHDAKNGAPWKPRSPVAMPRWASRLTLIVTDVRIQRIQDISAADAIAEGCHVYASSATIDCDTPDPRQEYRRLWNSLHGPDAWDANPWVAALTFTVHRQNIDQMEPTND